MERGRSGFYILYNCTYARRLRTAAGSRARAGVLYHFGRKAKRTTEREDDCCHVTGRDRGEEDDEG
jgi:hypothetical protein